MQYPQAARYSSARQQLKQATSRQAVQLFFSCSLLKLCNQNPYELPDRFLHSARNQNLLYRLECLLKRRPIGLAVAAIDVRHFPVAIDDNGGGVRDVERIQADSVT